MIIEKVKPAISILTIVISSAVVTPVYSAPSSQKDGIEEAEFYSPYVTQNYPNNVYFGDTHLHTNLSVDAYNFANKLGPEVAYRFAKGEEVIASNGMKVKLRRPLDFLVIADHASNVGLMTSLEEEDPSVLKTDIGRRWYTKLQEVKSLEKSDFEESRKLAMAMFMDGFVEEEVVDSVFLKSVWKKNVALADKHNAPGQFTALIGYEWTGWYYNLHRVVIFKDDADLAGKVIPFSQYDSIDPEDLWSYLADYEKTTGGEVLAIPHNGNLSTGVMFALQDAKGNVLSKEYAKMRSRWEPLYEVTQIKGDGETHPVVSPNDEFADYETWALTELSDVDEQEVRSLRDPKARAAEYKNWFRMWESQTNFDWARQFEYARPALKIGLQQQAKIGVNPFKFGMIGSTDAHTSLASADEDNFWGKAPWYYVEQQPSKERVKNLLINDIKNRTHSASGYAAVWAHENTRDSLFAAMKRKETYATTGPRMKVRFFGGWNYNTGDALRPNLAKIGYSGGVPMGGDLTNAPNGKSLRFLIRAVKDPDGANLDRVQVIKGWHDKNGELHEKVYNVALSDDRVEDKNGIVPIVGSTVDISDASYTNSIGDPELAVVWTDPDFDARELAFYYVRVIEIPTPRWTAYDAKFFKIKDIPAEVPMVTQERAYTSPIWYSPSENLEGR